MNSKINDVYRGDTIDYNLKLVDENGNPVDITGCTIWFTAKTDITNPDSQAVLQKKITNHLNPTGGLTKLFISANETANLIPDTVLFYDFQIVTPTGTVRTLTKGKFKVLQDVTFATTL